MELLFNSQQIAIAVNRLATEISHDYKGKNPLLIGVLKGSFIFMADLIRHLDFPLEIDFVQLSSYGRDTNSSGRIKVRHDIHSHIEGRDVLVIEDIVDSGLTISFLFDYLRKKDPSTLKLCTLLNKPSRRHCPVATKYIGLTVPYKFVVGYGLDCAEQYRNLSEIYFLTDADRY